MYNNFFDFGEKPFKLVPNPEFLFLGKSHEEALAHLTYATTQGDGFVEITGEVGTGKTTLCRVFLENLDKDIEAAFIFNSSLDSCQLLKAIHSELGITCSATDPADMTLALNEFLLKKKAQGKSVILLIDEAQNLGAKTLEQLRLLSNLETTRSKLLQIILVGQPELREILDSYELRQLRQRINLSCHILPLTSKETYDYIEHRINVASRKPRNLFTRSAQKEVYAYSCGIPRLINIVCDRSLLAAYSLNQKKVSCSIVRTAIRELSPQRQTQPNNTVLNKTVGVLVFVAFCSAIFYLAFFSDRPLGKMFQKISAPSGKADAVEKTTLPAESVKMTQQDMIPEKIIQSKPDLFPIPSSENTQSSKKTKSKDRFTHTIKAVDRETAFSFIMTLWNHPSLIQPNELTRQIESDPAFFKISAIQNNFQLLHFKKDLSLVDKLNLPAILGFSSADGIVTGYLALSEIRDGNEYILLQGRDEKQIKITLDELLPYFTGDVYILWKDIFGHSRIISETSPEDSIVMLKLLLAQIGFSSIDLTPDYDDTVKEAVKQIQKKYGLVEDGLVGPLTKIILYSEKRDDAVPFLNRTGFSNNQLKNN